MRTSRERTMTKSKVKKQDFHSKIESPATIKDLKRAIKNLRDNLLLFEFAYGDEHGETRWTRKETWKKYTKRLLKETKAKDEKAR